jgi:site-specific recombinase XerD
MINAATTRTPKALGITDWPLSDQLAWQDALTGGDLFESSRPAARWAQSSRTSIAWNYGRWLGHLSHHELVNDEAPAERVTPSQVTVYVEELQETVRPQTVATYLAHLYDAIRVMAPDRDWAWLKAIKTRLARGLKSDGRKAVRIQDSARLFELGLSLMGEAMASGREDLGTAITYRDGLMIALLAARPIRRRNLAAIRIGKELQKVGDHWCLIFEARQTKQSRYMEFPLPRELTLYIGAYLRDYRKRLLGHDRHEYLWVSARGGRLVAGQIYHLITKRTAAEFGNPINPHLFRDCAATTLARRDPEHINVAASVLGHAGLRTTEKHYNQARMIDAARKYQRELQRLRAERAHG